MGKIRTKVIETAIEPEKLKKIEEVEKEPTATTVKEEKRPQKPPRQRGKRYKSLVDSIDRTKEYPADEAIKKVLETATTKFDASIEAHINFGLQPDKSEHQIRTLVTLPHRVGKKIKILVFTSKNTAEIKKLGAEVGTESTLKAIESEKVEFNKIIADSTWVPKLAKVAKVLGPRGLMPNPKSGTVTDNPLATVKEFAQGRIELKTEKFPIIHTQIGKASFTEKQLLENLQALISALNAARPEGLKKDFIKSAYLSSTMSPSIKVDPTSISGTDMA